LRKKCKRGASVPHDRWRRRRYCLSMNNCLERRNASALDARSVSQKTTGNGVFTLFHNGNPPLTKIQKGSPTKTAFHFRMWTSSCHMGLNTSLCGPAQDVLCRDTFRLSIFRAKNRIHAVSTHAPDSHRSEPILFDQLRLYSLRMQMPLPADIGVASYGALGHVPPLDLRQFNIFFNVL